MHRDHGDADTYRDGGQIHIEIMEKDGDRHRNCGDRWR
jgi:hypothetical protein